MCAAPVAAPGAAVVPLRSAECTAGFFCNCFSVFGHCLNWFSSHISWWYYLFFMFSKRFVCSCVVAVGNFPDLAAVSPVLSVLETSTGISHYLPPLYFLPEIAQKKD